MDPRKNRVSRGRVRIIGGRWRGRQVVFPEVRGLRPTPDRVRETVFNWLTPYLPGARVLDLFAGSGVMGFESLSRGASTVVAVENNRRVADGLRESAGALGAAGFEVSTSDVMAFLRTPRERPYDVIFLDPPYAYAHHQALCAALDESGLMTKLTLVYVEFPTPRTFRFTAPASWEKYRSSRAGRLTYELWHRPGGPD